jgi:Plasmid pRiA4b ORF-3-like protein
MGWQDYHLHEFQFSAVRYGVPDPDFPDNPLLWNEARVKLENALSASESFNYLYDFGDGWEHRVEVERIPSADSKLRWPRCTAGENACPPQDIGGPGGYAEFLRSIADPAEQSHDGMPEWGGGRFNPAVFDLILVNQNLVEIKL